MEFERLAQRMKNLRVLSLLLVLFLTAHVSKTCLAETGWRIEELSPGVYAALEPREERFNDSNSVFIVGEHDVVVVDSQANSERIRQLISELKKLTNKPVRFVVNTHWHGDHTDGNWVWSTAFPDVDFIAHHTVKDDMLNRAVPDRENQIVRYEEGIAQAEDRLQRKVDTDGKPMGSEEEAALSGAIERARARLQALHEVKTVLPTWTYEEQLTLHRDGREIQLLHFVAHTRGDTVVYLPQEKLLITGDLLDELPFGGHGYPASWLATLDHLESLDFTRVVPGHGDVLAGKGQLRLVRELLHSLREQVSPLVAAGKGLEEVLEAVDFEDFRSRLTGGDPVAERNFNAFLPGLVERIYQEAHGELE